MKSNVMKCLAVMLILGLLAATGAIAADSSITGTVAKTDKGIVINADDGATYNVMGADLSDMVGKTVKATGTVTDAGGAKVITVVSIQPAK